jgi:hypothetical protein
MKTFFLLFALSLIAATSLNAQLRNEWVGGTPGRPIDWNVASNWSLQRVPDEFHDVVIPNTSSTTFSWPVIDELVEIRSLRIESGAKLVILETGYLHIDADVSLMKEALVNRGEIENRSMQLIGFNDDGYRRPEGFAQGHK